MLTREDLDPNAQAPTAEDAASNGKAPRGDGDLPAIQVNDRALRDVTADVLDALERANTPPAVFVRGGALARVRRDEQDRPLIEALGESELRGHAARAADCHRLARKEAREDVAPPIDVVRDVLALGGWPFPPLAGIIEAPALRPDGTVIDQPGYDLATGLVYEPAAGLRAPNVPVAPTAGDLADAVALLDEATGDFPFADEPSRANAIALLLTPIIRPSIGGQVPLALLDAPKAGTGKGLLANLAATVATGTAGAMLPAPRRDEEWAKVILAALARGSTFIVIDEAAELGSPALAAALTAPIFEGRILGRSAMAQVPQRATWAAAGNNIQLRGDLARRCYWIRLDAKTSRPWQRTGFRHPDLLAWAAHRRGDLLGALLTLGRSWHHAGRPGADVPTIGGFTDWSTAIGGTLAHAGITGFLANLTDLYDQADQEANAWEAWLAAWENHYGENPVTVAELTADLGHDGPLRDALPDELADALSKSPASMRSKLGKALAKRAGTRYGDRGMRVERAAKDARTNIQGWKVVVDDLQRSQRSQRSGGPLSRAGGRAHAPAHASGAENTSATSAPLHGLAGPSNDDDGSEEL